jgi:hypothetical protein
MVTTSLKAISPDAFDAPKARHLLSRAGFGGPPEQVEALLAMGLDKAVDHLVDYESVDKSDLPTPDYDPDIMRPPTEQERDAMREARLGRRGEDTAVRDQFRAEFLRRQYEDRLQMGRLEQWWIGRIIATPRPLEEKLTVLWHSHFASNHRTVHDSFLMLKQNALLRNHATNFADLAVGIVRDPAMIRFLNNDANRKAHPNENLARELMELFTLGEGNYSENDIKEGARALTGYAAEDNDFVFRDRVHDTGDKTILGQRGEFDGEDFVRILLNRPACSIFVAYKLYRHFVGDLDGPIGKPQESVIRQLAGEIADRRFNLKPALKKLFKSEHFYAAEVMGNQIKSPIQLLAGTVRTLLTPTRDPNVLADAMTMMGQKLFDPPTVAGWAGGRDWINTSTLFVRQNLATYLIAGKLPYNDQWNREGVSYDPSFLVEGVEKKPEAMVDRVVSVLLAGDIPVERRAELMKFMKERRDATSADALIALLLLVTAMPEYQLC